MNVMRPSEKIAVSVSPPTQKATHPTMPSATEKAGRSHLFAHHSRSPFLHGSTHLSVGCVGVLTGHRLGTLSRPVA